MFQVAPLPLTERALNKFGELFTQYLKDAIGKKIYPYGNPQRGLGDKVATGKLLDSISYDVEVDTNGDPMLVISYIDYFQNVNWGRRKEKGRLVRKKGRLVLEGGVPIPALLEWIKVRGLQGRNRKGQFIPRLSFAFAIQRNIYKFGIRPANIYDKGLDGLLDFVDNPPPGLEDEWQDVFDMITEDVNRFIEKTITIELPSKID
jgi:hypothetical protein